MQRILRQLTPEELRQAALCCGRGSALGGSASPEEIIRCLSRLCGATTWGLFPATTDDALLDHAGRRLGMPPLAPGPRALFFRERAIFGCYLRQAWEGVDRDRRWAVLSLALSAWDHPVLPRPEVPTDRPEDAALQAVLEILLQHSAGCRALATAAVAAPLPLPSPSPLAGPIKIAFINGAAGHQALYGVLLVAWRARTRLLRERRTQRVQLERQLRQVESLVTVRSRNLNETPVHWALNPAGGISLTAAAGVSVAVHTMLAATAPVTLVPALLVGCAGLAWYVSAATLRPRPETDPRVLQMHSQVNAFRLQLAQLERDLLELETE